MALTQKHRRLAISSPLGEDVLLFRRMTVSENLGELFSCDLEILSEDHDIRLDDLVGQNLSVRYEMPESGQMRYFNGFVSQFRYAGMTSNLALYHAQLRPWLWFLTRTTDSRIFQEKTVPDIIKEIFRDYGFTDFDDRLSETYRTWEYCVQHRETDCNFVCRLMEQEGIYFYFLHEADKHTLVLADSISGHDFCPGYERVPYYPADSADVREEDHISDWSVYQEAQPGACTLRAFDFKVPKKNLEGRQSQPLEHAFADFEIYDYADDYWEPDQGQTYARIRLEEIHGQFERVQGSGNVSGFFAGGLFEYYGYPRSDQNREYLIISTTIELSQDVYETGSSGGEESFCQCHFTALDNQRPFRTPRITPKPRVQGPQTAMVVGPAGEEIYTDEHSRVKIQFHWDREGSNDENSSCWIRVSQPWAGKAWGGISIPRIGQEVIVSFLEGDPDKPMITGRVYNGDSMPPYSLPGNMTQSGLKSRSSKGGTGDNFNEIRFEDKKGAEQIYIHAEKDIKVHVENTESREIEASSSTTAGGAHSVTSGATISETAAENITRTAQKNIVDTSGANITTEATSNMKLEAGGSYQLRTNLGIHLKAMNFVAALIVSGAEEAAKAIKTAAAKGGIEAAAAAGQAHATGGGAGAAAGGQLAEGAASAGMQALAALSPGIEAGAAELGKLSDQAKQRGENLSQPVNNAIASADALGQAIESGASPEAIAAAFMAMADAVSQAFGDAKALVEGLLPQIPSIVLWAMKDVNAYAIWSMSLQTEVRDISIQAKKRDIHVKAKQNINLKAEDKKVVIEAGKQIILKCGKASISLAESGDIVIKGTKINIKGKEPVTIKGKPIKLN